ncbi:MAG: HD domain-containing protein [Chitinivibrionales bacterium]|nr:HD domain-containing protein [Chitinivibrionales bacterium]
MDSEARKIDIAELEVGMHLEDVFNDKGVCLYAANTLISNPDQIEKLKRQKVSSVYINIYKGRDTTSPPPAPGTRTVANSRAERVELDYYKELPQARAVRRDALVAAKEVMDTIRKGRSFSVESIEKSAEDIVDSILRNPDALISLCQIKGHDEYTYTHSVNVGILVTSLAASMDYREEQLLHTGIGGLLHDVGKMRVPDSILNKPGRYADWEFGIMKKHPAHGIDIIKGKKAISEDARKVVLQHHERCDGSGYPFSLTAENISEIGLIAAVADVYDALTSDRVYRAAWTPQKALALIFQGADSQYSKTIVERFTRHLGIYPVGSFVRLVSQEMGIVVRIEKGKLLAPIVLILFDAGGRRLKEPVEYDLFKMQQTNNENNHKIEMSLDPRVFRINVGEYLEGKAVT